MSTPSPTPPADYGTTMENQSVDLDELFRRSRSKLVFPDDSPVVAPRELARELGIDRAVILQQLYFLLRNKRNGKIIGGKRWIYNTYEQWREDHFPWLSLMTIRRRFSELESEDWIESCQPDSRISRRKYYRLSDRFIAAIANTLPAQIDLSTSSISTLGSSSE